MWALGFKTYKPFSNFAFFLVWGKPYNQKVHISDVTLESEEVEPDHYAASKYTHLNIDSILNCHP